VSEPSLFGQLFFVAYKAVSSDCCSSFSTLLTSLHSSITWLPGPLLHWRHTAFFSW